VIGNVDVVLKAVLAEFHGDFIVVNLFASSSGL
jgi:hypothetical protein